MEVERKIYEEVLKLPEDEQKEILDFIKNSARRLHLL